MSRIIISDPHGCYKTLMALIAQLPKDVPITFGGDLIDRGRDSKQIVDFVKNGGYDCVRGNHEQMMIDDLSFRTRENGSEQIVVDEYNGIWTMNGGDDTLRSYIVDGEYDIKTMKEHHEWMNKLPHFLEYPELKNAKGEHLLVTHTTAAEVWGEKDPESQEFKDHVMWERNPMPPKIEGIYNVYGHTPQEGGATVKDHFAAIDGGAYFRRPYNNHYGRMLALQFPEMKVYVQPNVEEGPA